MDAASDETASTAGTEAQKQLEVIYEKAGSSEEQKGDCTVVCVQFRARFCWSIRKRY